METKEKYKGHNQHSYKKNKETHLVWSQSMQDPSWDLSKASVTTLQWIEVFVLLLSHMNLNILMLGASSRQKRHLVFQFSQSLYYDWK